MTKYKVVDKLTKKGYPESDKHYQSAHKETDVKEKKKFPKGYAEMKKVDAKLPEPQLAGKNLKSGKIEVSKKVPVKYRKEVAFHEETEHKNLKRMDKKK